MGEVIGGLSMQERMRLRRAGAFVGRVAEVASFRGNLRLPPDDPQRRFLFSVYGDAGVGKSSLVRHLVGIASEEGALCAAIDYPVNDVLSAMDSVSGQFGLSSSAMPAFSTRLAAYRRHRRELENDPNAPGGSGRMLAKLALRVGLRAAGDLPVVGALAEELDADVIVDETERLRSFIGSKLGKHDEVQLLLTPVEVLTPLFVADIRRLAGHRPIALFFDTYERSAPVLDDWLRELVDGRHGDLPANLTITVAGQHELDANRWAEYLGEIVQMPLNPFSDGDARELLKLHGVTDERIVDVIVALSGRLPLLLAMLAKGNPADPRQVGDRSGEAVERFLKWVDDGRHRQVALLAALPRQVNQDVLGALVRDDDVDNLFEWLRGQAFLSETHGVCRYHDVVRSPMLRQQRGQAPQRWRQNHTALADAHAGWRRALGLAEDEGWHDSRWCDLVLEETYHRLCSDALPAMPGALASVVYALKAKPSAARNWAEMMEQAGRDADIGQIERIGARLLQSIDAGASMAPFLTIVLNQPGIAEEPRMVALLQRAFAYVDAGQVDLAIRDFDRVIEARPGDARAMVWRGQAWRLMKRYEEAFADLTQAIEIDPGWVFAITTRGRLLEDMGRKEEALEDFTRAIQINPSDTYAISFRGQLLGDMGRKEEALADLTQAIEIDPGYVYAISTRGRLLEDMGRKEEALADLTQAIEIDPGYVYAISTRGRLLGDMGRNEEALADLTQAIGIDPGYVYAISTRGRLLGDMGRNEEALADLTRAIEIDPGYDYAIATRGRLLGDMGRKEEALADWTRVIEINPRDVLAIVIRGRLLRDMGRKEEALAELTRAIEIDPGDTYAISVRARLLDEVAANVERRPQAQDG